MERRKISLHFPCADDGLLVLLLLFGGVLSSSSALLCDDWKRGSFAHLALLNLGVGVEIDGALFEFAAKGKETRWG